MSRKSISSLPSICYRKVTMSLLHSALRDLRYARGRRKHSSDLDRTHLRRIEAWTDQLAELPVGWSLAA